MHIEPGQSFSVEYGSSGATCEVKALSLREKLKVVELLQKVEQARGPEAFVLMAEALELVAPGKLDDPGIDERLAAEIVGRALAGASVSVEQAKKSESLH